MEFFSTFEYRGRIKTLYFIRGPMFYKQGKCFRSKQNESWRNFIENMSNVIQVLLLNPES